MTPEVKERIRSAVRDEFWRILDEQADDGVVDLAVQDVLECSGLGAGEDRWSPDDVVLAVRRVLLRALSEFASVLPRAGSVVVRAWPETY